MAAAKFILQICSGDRVVAELPVNGDPVSFQLLPIPEESRQGLVSDEVTRTVYPNFVDDPVEEDSTQGFIARAKRQYAPLMEETTPQAAPRREVYASAQERVEESCEATIEMKAPIRSGKPSPKSVC